MEKNKKTTLEIDGNELVIEYNDFYSFKELTKDRVEVIDLEIGDIMVGEYNITSIVDPEYIELELEKALIEKYNSSTSDAVWRALN